MNMKTVLLGRLVTAYFYNVSELFVVNVVAELTKRTTAASHSFLVAHSCRALTWR